MDSSACENAQRSLPAPGPSRRAAGSGALSPDAGTPPGSEDDTTSYGVTGSEHDITGNGVSGPEHYTSNGVTGPELNQKSSGELLDLNTTK